MRFPEHLRYKICRDRIMRRRKVVVRTLNYLNDRRRIVATNEQWKSPRQSRRRLLDEIYGWYDKEMRRIDTVLAGLGQRSSRVEQKRESGTRSDLHGAP